ncbi:TPA: hypothetical protein N0F65_005029 [Lagenidium giganteum]|uniref:Uncharacterized protein n=1 Tax=Lagenidium giganteum TaxID=4803 RepID=A0AAV2ZLH7_9STRA|nr:TPA: hypothetical protein N0F65_005029 [Lagenidium giganteum]
MRVFNMNVAEIDVPMYERGPNFNHWRRRFLSKMAAHGMVEIVLGNEFEHDRMNDRERRCFRAREAKANGLLVAKLSDDIGDQFSNDIYAGALECEFGRGDDANTVFIRRDLYNRLLRHGERVDVYVNDLLRMRSDINRNNDEVKDKELARIMLSNVLNVYREVTREYDDNARRNIFPSLREATSRSYAVERLAQQLDDNRRGDQRGLDGRQVNNVTRGKQRGCSRSVSSTSSSKRRKIHETVEQTKARSYCARCSEVNVSGNIDLFTQLCDDGSHVLYMTNGAEQVVTQKGKVLMKVLNEYTKQREDRILEDSTCGFYFHVARGGASQRIRYLEKKSLTLKLIKTSGTYKLQCGCTNKRDVFSVRSDPTAISVHRAHMRFAHVSPLAIESLVQSGNVNELNRLRQLRVCSLCSK